MNTFYWLIIIIMGVFLLIILYYLFFLLFKIIMTFLPALTIILIGAYIGFRQGGFSGGIIMFISIIIALISHDKWENSDFYQKIEKFFEKNTSV